MNIQFDSPVPYSEEWWRVTLSSIGDAVIVTDIEGRVTFMNAVAQSLTGWAEREAKSRSLEEIFPIIHEGSRVMMESPVSKVIQTGGVVELTNHTILLAKNGFEIAVDDSAAPIRDEQGNIFGVVLVFRDISERKRAEAVQLELAAIIESSDDAIISNTLDGIITSWNRGAERIYGYTAAEIIGKSLSILTPPDRADEVPAILERLKRGQRIEHYETVRRRKDRTLIDISLAVSPIIDHEGHIIGVSKIARDITERKRAEAAQVYLAAIVESSDDAIIGKTLEGIITSWNRGAERMFGYTAAEAIGQPIRILIPPERHGEVEQILSKLREGERIEHFETVRVRKDGQRRDISLTISPIRDDAGRIIGASKIARDITERKRMEKERQQLLEREQAARTRAEEANRLKDEFLATVSHELRTPLNAILGWAKMLHGGTLDTPIAQRAIETIRRSAEAQAQLITDILDVSRIVSGRLRLNVSTVELASIIELAIETMRPAAEAKQVHIESILDSTSGSVSGDPERLQQVVWNLLSNAVKFTPKGGRVQVRLEHKDSHVEIIVSDTGEGIKKEFLPHVFDRFRQADSSSTRSHGGLGLGLAIVRHLIELHGGIVRAESPGEELGATFTVRLPIALSQRTTPPIEHSIEGGFSFESAPDLTGITVLVVDDEPNARELLSAMLEKYGAQVRSAGSASQALGLLEEGQPTILVSDIGMPEENGYELIKKVRRRGIQTPAIALTAYARSEDRLQALSAGFQIHIAKPVDPVELVIVVASLAGRMGKG